MSATGSVGLGTRLKHLASSDRSSGLIMLGFAFAGLLLANMPWTSQWFVHLSETEIGIPNTDFFLSVSDWAQDGLLTVFFLCVGLDLKQELTTGSLSNPKAAAVPMLAAVGGMAIPPVVFLIVSKLFATFGPGAVGSEIIGNETTHAFSEIARGWAVPTATDIAFSLAILALFAKTLPGSIRAFLMTLATVDDLLGIVVIAVCFSSVNEWYWFAGIVVCAVIWSLLVRMKKVLWILVAMDGILAWVMMFEAGIHPTLAGVLVGLLTPANVLHGEDTPRAERYHDKLNPFSALLALPIFALFATGIHFDDLGPHMLVSPVVMGIALALIIGKPCGVMLVTWFTTKACGLKLPKGLRVRDLFPMATACGIGFTVSFLIASLAFRDSELSGEARLGVLVGSIISAVIASILLSRQSKRYMAKVERHRAEAAKLSQGAEEALQDMSHVDGDTAFPYVETSAAQVAAEVKEEGDDSDEGIS
ncbi:Na+/H+ antiporter NhaA [Pseudoscardovia radai]|uniref:Na+/H+ antiporter NhaA n=1 Tax=Pseudoscardovia radai TaxID=987066 RepID=UPI00399393E1